MSAKSAKAYIERHVAAGLCASCNVEALEGFKYCRKHRQLRIQRNREHRIRNTKMMWYLLNREELES